MTKNNRIFPGWKKGKKNERPPGSFPARIRNHRIRRSPKELAKTFFLTHR
jgi:hypothetical protein